MCSSDLRALSVEPVFNPGFPTIPIGAYAPLIGARPFRRPAHSGSAFVTAAGRRGQMSVGAVFSGASDDSTFLSDADFGNSMLLPNRDLNPGYARIDAAADYALGPRLRATLRVDNVLDRAYATAYGFPALPRAVRVGLRLNLGGDGAQP